MIETWLILVEGLSGSGKSITGQHLSLHLQKLGCRAEWVYEHETPHPIYPQDQFHDALEKGGSLAVFDAAVENWRQFAARMKLDRTTAIMDGALFQTAIGSILAMDAEPDAPLQHVAQVLDAIRQSNPVVIYYYQPDVRQAINRIRELRGDAYCDYCVAKLRNTHYGRSQSVLDMDGVVAFFELQRQVADRAFSNLDIAKLSIENSAGDWGTYRKRIADFLLIPPMESPFRRVPTAGEFAGTYRQPESGDELTILENDQQLFLADETRTRLIPAAEDTFHLEGMCIDFVFRRHDPDHTVYAELTGKLPDLAKSWVKVQ